MDRPLDDVISDRHVWSGLCCLNSIYPPSKADVFIREEVIVEAGIAVRIIGLVTTQERYKALTLI